MAFTQNLLGDPEMQVWISKPPRLRVDWVHLPGRGEMTPVVSSDEGGADGEGHVHMPVPGARVYVRQGKREWIAQSDEEGAATLRIVPDMSGLLWVTVSAPGYLPYVDQLEPQPPMWVEGKVIEVIRPDDSASGDATTLIRLQSDVVRTTPAGVAYRSGYDAGEIRTYVVETAADNDLIVHAAVGALLAASRIGLLVDAPDNGAIARGFRLQRP
jgi:hypothetical protein